MPNTPTLEAVRLAIAEADAAKAAFDATPSGYVTSSAWLEAGAASGQAWEKAVALALAYCRAAPAVAGGWIAVDERLPEPCRAVLLCVESATSGRRYVIRAEHAAPNTMALGDDQEWWEGCTTDEHDDTYCPEGWYEHNQFDETNWLVTDKAIAWQPLPPPPGAAS